MQGRCEKHLFEQAEDRCGKCGLEYCAECLVYSFGPKRPPYCIPCAVSAAGIRNAAARGVLPKREAKRMERERKSAFAQAERIARRMPAAEPFLPMPAPTPAPVMESAPMGMPTPLAAQ